MFVKICKFIFYLICLVSFYIVVKKFFERYGFIVSPSLLNLNEANNKGNTTENDKLSFKQTEITEIKSQANKND